MHDALHGLRIRNRTPNDAKKEEKHVTHLCKRGMNAVRTRSPSQHRGFAGEQTNPTTTLLPLDNIHEI